MRKKLFPYLIVLMSVALIGIIFIQILWIKNAVDVKEQQFKQNVSEALVRLNKQLETKDALDVVGRKMDAFTTTYKIDIDSVEDSSQHSIISKIKIINDGLGKDIKIISDTLNHKLITSIGKIDSSIKLMSIITDSCDSYVTNYSSKGSEKIIIKSRGSKIKRKKKKISDVLNQIVLEITTDDLLNENKISAKEIIEILKKELSNYGIKQNFEFKLTEADSLLLISDNYKTKAGLKGFQQKLFPSAIIDKKSELLIYFPDKSILAFKSLGVPILGSLIFTLIIIVVFWMSVVYMLKQKKISEIKSDFINNMTHEFKTPIATISLAADSINSIDGLKNEKVDFFTKMIKSESKRMNQQVENVLQMALLDNKNIKLNLKLTDLHSLIDDVCFNLQLRIEKANGILKKDFNATNSNAFVDSIHFTNVVYNLLDNAIKYSKDSPEITIKTENTNGELIISIKDKGIGMNKEVKKRIFDKFYRPPTGNIHNVKGFGLGLSYVKEILNRHNAEIVVESEVEKGSSFNIKLRIPAYDKDL